MTLSYLERRVREATKKFLQADPYVCPYRLTKDDQIRRHVGEGRVFMGLDTPLRTAHMRRAVCSRYSVSTAERMIGPYRWSLDLRLIER